MKILNSTTGCIAASATVSLTLGENDRLSELATVVPVVLRHNGYSHANDSTANLIGFASVAKFDIDPKHCATIMPRLGVGQKTGTSSDVASHPGTTRHAEPALASSASGNTAH